MANQIADCVIIVGMITALREMSCLVRYAFNARITMLRLSKLIIALNWTVLIITCKSRPTAWSAE